PYDSTIAITALRMAMTTPRLTIVYTVLFEVASIKYRSGTGDVDSLASEGEPTSTAVSGISSAATVITSAHKMARAIRRDEPVVPSEKLPAWANPLSETTAPAASASTAVNCTDISPPCAPPTTGCRSGLQFFACVMPRTVTTPSAASSIARNMP